MERPRPAASPRRRPVTLLACAAAASALLLAGCSSGPGSAPGSTADGSGSTAGKSTSTGTGTPTSPGTTPGTSTPTPTTRFAALPAPCKTITAATVTALVPKAKSKAGTVARSADLRLRAGCSWTGNGKDGYQYRWLSVTLQRFAADPQLGSAADQAKDRFTTELQEVGKAAYGAPTSVVTGIGDEAAQVSGRTTIAKVTSQNDSVLVRTGNVVFLVEYDGAGLAGKKNPSATAVRSGAQRAARDVVAAVAAANG